MASQVAIAIENFSSGNDLQRTNVELSLAFDATNEGWAQTLKLKDLETEGHSRQVAQLTIDLARRTGIVGEILAHIHRGAL